VWLNYAKFEAENGEWNRMSKLHWRAKNTLENPTNFVREYVALNSQVAAAMETEDQHHHDHGHGHEEGEECEMC